jgi:hypothetical protein
MPIFCEVEPVFDQHGACERLVAHIVASHQGFTSGNAARKRRMSIPSYFAILSKLRGFPRGLS